MSLIKDLVLVYTTIELSHDSQQALLKLFNDPPRPITTPLKPIHFDLADTRQVSGVGDIWPLHKKALSQRGDDVDESFVILLDDGVAPSTHPQTVLLVKIPDGVNRSMEKEESRYQTVRVLASTVAEILATISSGRHKWESIWDVGQQNSGYFPGE